MRQDTIRSEIALCDVFDRVRAEDVDLWIGLFPCSVDQPRLVHHMIAMQVRKEQMIDL